MTDAQRHYRREEYTARINRVMDHIAENLDGDLRLATLAEVASFSPYHFHRLFRGMVGETINNHIRRVRAESAAQKLVHNPKLSITEIALACGYGSPSSFAREFRRAFDMSASEFRSGGHERWRKKRQAARKIGQAEGKIGQDTGDEKTYTGIDGLHDQRRSTVKATFEIKEMPAMHVAYVRHTGSYSKIGEAFGRLFKWAGPRGLFQGPDTKILAVYHDSPEVTEESKLRSSACLTVPEGTAVDGEVATMGVPGGTFAVGHFEIDVTEYGEAWDKLMGEYLPESGYQPDDRLCYEMYLNDPKEHPEQIHIVDICEPVKPL